MNNVIILGYGASGYRLDGLSQQDLILMEHYGITPNGYLGADHIELYDKIYGAKVVDNDYLVQDGHIAAIRKGEE
jgi:hypothetical protein